MKRFLLCLQLILTLNIFIYSQSNLEIAEIGNLKLTSGDVLENCKIGYRIFGQMNDDKSNIIIYLTWFGGTSAEIGSLVDKHHFIDTTKYCVIAIDALGNGISTSPSNYQKVFPKITIRDMVNAEYILLKEKLNLSHIFAAIGGSMGSMQALEWAVAYPGFIDKIVAYVASPKLTSYDLLWMNTQLTLIESGRKYGMPDLDIKKISDMMTALSGRTPDYIVKNVQLENFNEYLNTFDKEPSKTFTLDNYAAQIKSMLSLDIYKDYNDSIEKTAKAIKAELFIIVSKNDLMLNPAPALELAEVIGARTLILDNNCGHLAVSCELERCSKNIADFLKH